MDEVGHGIADGRYPASGRGGEAGAGCEGDVGRVTGEGDSTAYVGASRDGGDADQASSRSPPRELAADGGSPAGVEEPTPYVESQVIMTTVRAISPFVLTYGVFVTLHGADSPGGGFQGGVIMASVVVMLAFAFGIGPTRDWVADGALVGLTAGGLLLFGLAALLPLVGDGALLELFVLEALTGVEVKWWVELVEVAIGMIVAGVVIGLFFLLSLGVMDRSGGREGRW